MEPEEGKVFDYAPGQFAYLHILDESGKTVVKRPYSIASSPSAPYLEFCIKMVGGELTGKLERMGKGTVVGVEGPFGHFSYSGQPNAAFIAGGTGIAPFVSILRYIAEKKLEGCFILFYSARTSGSVVYGDELARLEKENPNIKVVITLTREEPLGWKGECGRINEGMIRKYAAKPADFDWWICGPMALTKAMKECLLGKGVDPKRLRMEGWG